MTAGSAAEVIFLEGWDKQAQNSHFWFECHHVEITHNPRDTRACIFRKSRW